MKAGCALVDESKTGVLIKWKDQTSVVQSPSEDNFFLLQAIRNNLVVQCSSMDPKSN